MITARTNSARGRRIDADRVCEAVNLADDPTIGIILARLREVFPEVIWTRDQAGRLNAAIPD